MSGSYPNGSSNNQKGSKLTTDFGRLSNRKVCQTTVIHGNIGSKISWANQYHIGSPRDCEKLHSPDKGESCSRGIDPEREATSSLGKEQRNMRYKYREIPKQPSWLKEPNFLEAIAASREPALYGAEKALYGKKMELFEEFLGRKSKANAFGDKLQMLKDDGLRVIVQEKALREEKDKLFKEDLERRKYKNHLVDEIEKCKKRKADNCIKLQHQKEKIFELQKENFE
eukprot:gene15423-16996_t